MGLKEYCLLFYEISFVNVRGGIIILLKRSNVIDLSVSVYEEGLVEILHICKGK